MNGGFVCLKFEIFKSNAKKCDLTSCSVSSQAAIMPPVLTMLSRNYDYDYDTVQPCFFLDGEEEDFYLPPCSQLLPGPGEDIWKKFELLPTPPLSPSRRPSLSDIPLSAADHLEAVSDLLDEDYNSSAAFLQSFIIQDCMWSSSFAAATELEKVVSERLASLRARRDSSTTNNTNTPTDRATDQQVGSSQVNTGYLQDLHTAATDCIDPSVVFPYTTLSEKSGDGAVMEVAPELCLDSPPLSSSDSESGGKQAFIKLLVEVVLLTVLLMVGPVEAVVVSVLSYSDHQVLHQNVSLIFSQKKKRRRMKRLMW